MNNNNQGNYPKQEIETKSSVEKIPRMMTVRQVAATGILPERALRTLLKQKRLPAMHVGVKALINYDELCHQLNTLNERGA